MSDNNIRQREFSLSIIVPMRNEASVCKIFFERTLPIISKLTEDFEIICVDDGSTDETLTLLDHMRSSEPRIKIISLTRQFGKEIAMTAGIDHATGDAVIPMDADLQDPPELLPEMVAKWQEGFDTVIAIRTDRRDDTLLKKVTANLFYRIIGSISDIPITNNAGDFRLLDRVVVTALNALPERNRFMKGLFAWVGFRQAEVYFSRPKRVSGKSKWKFRRLWNFALEGILSFSTLPLRVWSYLGFLLAAFATIYICIIVIRTVIFGVTVPGYASLLVTILFFSGLNMIGLGILGEYVGRIFLEVKQRPLYLIQSSLGVEEKKDRSADSIS